LPFFFWNFNRLFFINAFKAACLKNMIYAGTCSWAEKTLVQSGEFYPEGINTAEKRLRYYSSFFSAVEVDATYYAIPSQKTVMLWADRTPDDFTFHVKAYGALTGHGVSQESLPPGASAGRLGAGKRVYIDNEKSLLAAAAAFKNSLLPLGEKLGLVVFQFPQWFRFGKDSIKRLIITGEMMKGFSLGIEFRHGSWMLGDNMKQTLGFLEKNQMTYITADEPQYGTQATAPFLPAVTTETAYFRFHGRNRADWLRKSAGVSERYKYLYSDDELKTFLKAAMEADNKTAVTFAMFNNCFGGFAVNNALRFMELAG
jgi:uncharacterized protein YecE (DUF72 family)